MNTNLEHVSSTTALTLGYSHGGPGRRHTLQPVTATTKPGLDSIFGPLSRHLQSRMQIVHSTL